MSASIGARSRIAIKPQLNYVTPAAANGFFEVPMSTYALETVKAGLESATLRSDREVSDWRHGARNGTGQIVADLRFGDPALELLIQSALMSTWASNEITIGTTRTWLTAEDQALDTGIFRRGLGMEVSRLGISMQPGQMIVLTADLVGRDVEAPAGATKIGTVTGAVYGNEPMDAFSGSIFDQIPSSGQELNIITGFDLQIDNGIRPVQVVGDPLPTFQEYGRGRVTGTITALYTDLQQVTRFVNETTFGLNVAVQDPAGNDYVFTLPRVKYSGAQVPVANEQTRQVTLPFVALRPASGTIQSALRIQR